MPPDEAAEDSDLKFVAGDFLHFIEGFLETLEALHDLVAATPRFEELDSPARRMERLRALVDEMPDEQRRPAVEAIGRHFDRMRDLVRQRETVLSSVESVEESKRRKSGGVYGPLIDDLSNSVDPHWVVVISDEMHRYGLRPRRLEILARSVVISAVSAFEVLIAGLVGQYYELYPGAIGGSSKDKEFSLEDLRSLGSIEEARQLAISRRVEDFLWLSASEWADWFKKGLKLDFSSLVDDWDATLEIFERRNIMVHNNSIVSRRYLDRVSDSHAAEVGTRLNTTVEYANSALHALMTLGLLAAISTWQKLVKPHLDFAAGTLTTIVYDQMLLGRWPEVRTLCETGRKLKSSKSTHWVFECNRWLAIKRLGSVADIEDEVREWDPSAMSLLYRFVRLVLLDEIAEALTMLPRVVAGGELPRDALYEWPILEELRSDSRFASVARDLYLDDGPSESAAAVPLTPRSRVLVSHSGGTFHRRECRYASSSAEEMTRSMAKARKIRPCKACRP
jgi:hypothetical protein